MLGCSVTKSEDQSCHPLSFFASVSFFFYSVFRYDRRMRNDGHEVHEKHGFWDLVLGGRRVGFLEFLSSFRRRFLHLFMRACS